MNKWEVAEHEQWSENVRVNAFVRPCFARQQQKL